MAISSSFEKWKFVPLIVGIIVIIGSTNVSGRLLGAEKCTWGPSYWCQGIRQSSKVILYIRDVQGSINKIITTYLLNGNIINNP